jgi:glycosyltransferase involved in cell wall biosynthesis
MSVCLNMIVRDEAAVIERCLASVRPFIDCWLIVDTGSVDDTPERIERALAGLPGEIHHRPWVNFGHNRTEALELARGKADYLLFIDADEQLAALDGAAWPELVEPAYSLEARYSELRYDRVSLVSTKLPWRWVGVLHEYLDAGRPVAQPRVPGFWITVTPDGARSTDPRKFEKDAAVLAAALQDEPDNARYAFYLAQSYRDAGQFELARAHYRRRAAMGGWDEEVWYSLFQIARLSQLLGDGPAEVLAAYLRAHEMRPGRAEALVELATYLRGRQDWESAYAYSRIAVELPLPADRLFVDAATYRWRARDELALAAFYTGRSDEAATLWRALLDCPDLPSAEIERIRRNLDFVPAAGNDAGTDGPQPQIRLNVGCGRSIQPGWVNLDSVALPGVDIVCDLETVRASPIALPAGSVERFLLSHVIEHIRDSLGLMQELWRLAAPGAVAEIRVPHGGSDDAWEDPTHVRAYFINSFGYFSQPYYWRADYGYRGDWQPERLRLLVDRSRCQGLTSEQILAKVQAERNVVRELICELRAVKPLRAPTRELQRSPLIDIVLAD